MKTHLPRISFAFLATALVSASLHAQTSSTPTTTPKPATHKPAAGSPAVSTAMKLPPNIPVVKGIPKTEFALKYIDAKIGTGDLAKPGIKYTVHYTLWLHDGTKIDSSVDKGIPFEFTQGRHMVIAGWDGGFDGMRVGGKRRLFIPWQLAYGEAGRDPIPARADLIFDIEFIAQTDPNVPPPPPPAAPQSATPPQ
jgi:peptidylprolyl isomerase